MVGPAGIQVALEGKGIGGADSMLRPGLLSLSF